ncbi:hypothetical protein AYI69_g6548 [Smittium culicis]|uniref:Mitochondrial carrier n=1 Tax=Smittium culicis TaxID=133412 RepID=A0A1R1XYE6_9FUNG|nr:hypothetical protein AYI69_g6548 [Smittium culicis]
MENSRADSAEGSYFKFDNDKKYFSDDPSLRTLDSEISNPLDFLKQSKNDSNVDSLQLSGFSSGNQDYSYSDITNQDVFDLGVDPSAPSDAIRSLFTFAGFRLGISLLVNPIVLSQTLLQVQCRSNEINNGDKQEELDEDYEIEEIQRSLQSGYSTSQNHQQIGHGKANRDGYIGSVNINNKNRIPTQPYQIDPSNQTKYSVITALLSHPTEGTLSLFKGSFSRWAYEMLHLLLQPTIESVINESTGVYDDSLSLQFNDTGTTSIFAIMASHLIVGYLLSPLEIVRTRLSVQSLSPIHRKYNGVFDCLKKINSEEGGIISGVYLNPFHVIPALIQHTINPFFSSMGNVVFSKLLDLDPYMDPIKLSLASLFWRLSQLFISLPVDTIRKRLMAQPNYKFIGNGSTASRSKFKEFKTVVRISPFPYTGMINCAWRVITEEGAITNKPNFKDIPNKQAPYEYRKRSSAERSGYKRDSGIRPDSSSSKSARSSQQTYQFEQQTSYSVGSWGLRGLYPGLISSVALNLSIFGLRIISSDIDESAY